MTLSLLDEAREEMRQSAHWYDSKRIGLGEDFLRAVELAFELIEQHPKRSKRLKTRYAEREVRQTLLRRFPFVIVYEIVTDEIIVVAVAHGKRKPKYWQDRLA